MTLLASFPDPTGYELQRIAFGSCAHQDKPQPIWDTIRKQSPDLFLFIGDCVYADSLEPDDLARTLNVLAAKPEFQRFIRSCPLLAIWDDHDYGLNDYGGEHPAKAAAQQVFLKFFEAREDSPRWRRPGLFDAITFGSLGRRVQVILLDTRYHRSALPKARVGRYRLSVPQKDPSTTILGARQWTWLQEVLQQPAELRIVVSSIQILPDLHGGEKWSNFPHERTHLLELLDGRRESALLLISGDQHLGELSRLRRGARGDLYELTASGMTHTRTIIAPNQRRVGPQVLDNHFGMIEVQWTAPPRALLKIVDVDGKTRLQHAVPFDEIR